MSGLDAVPAGLRVTSCDLLCTDQWVHYKKNATAESLEEIRDEVMSQVRANQEGIWVVGRTYAGQEVAHDCQAIQPPDGMVALRDATSRDLWADPDLFWEALRGMLRMNAIKQKTSAAFRGLVLYLPRASMHATGKGGRGRGGGLNAGGVSSGNCNDGR